MINESPFLPEASAGYPVIIGNLHVGHWPTVAAASAARKAARYAVRAGADLIHIRIAARQAVSELLAIPQAA